MSDQETKPYRYLSNEDLDDLLNRCLLAIEHGEATIESCVLQHPDLKELGPMLEAAAVARKLPEVDFSDSSFSEVQKRILANYRTRYGPKTSAHQ